MSVLYDHDPEVIEALIKRQARSLMLETISNRTALVGVILATLGMASIVLAVVILCILGLSGATPQQASDSALVFVAIGGILAAPGLLAIVATIAFDSIRRNR